MSNRLSNRSHKGVVVCLLLALPVAGVHAFLTWGYITHFMGDYGVNLHQIERAIDGEVVYKDFFYGAPPLGIWAISAVLRFFGAEMIQVWIYSLVVYFFTVALYAWLVARIVPIGYQSITVAAGLLVALAYTTWQAAPLPLGSYFASSPIGFLFLIAAVHSFLSGVHKESVLPILATGVFAGLCILAKQDYWMPALVLFGAAVFLALRSSNYSNVLVGVTSLAVITGMGALKIVADSGWEALTGVLHGFGLAEIHGIGRALPTWKRVTIESLALVMLVGLSIVALLASRVPVARPVGVLAALGIIAVLLASTYTYMASQKYTQFVIEGLPEFHTWYDRTLYESANKRGVLQTLLRLLSSDLLDHLIPFILPPILLLAFLLFGTRRLDKDHATIYSVLLLVCVTARFRRGFEHLDWFNVLLEFPTYVAIAAHLGKEKISKAVFTVILVIALVGVYAYWAYGFGPLTRKGAHPLTETARGSIHIPERQAELLAYLEQKLDAIDPERVRPVFSFGHNGGISYFLKRPNPSSVTFGFLTSVIPPDRAVAEILNADPPYFLVYTAIYEHAPAPIPSINLGRWDQQHQVNHYISHDLPIFTAMSSKCREITDPDAEEKFQIRIFDCKQG